MVDNGTPKPPADLGHPPTCQSIDWYGEGEARIAVLGNVTVEVRMIARKGRKARIAITAPAGAVFWTKSQVVPAKTTDQ